MQYERLEKGKTPVLAVCYDFDRTLTPGDMQAQGFIQSVGADVNEFWKQSNEFAINNDMDMNLLYACHGEAGARQILRYARGA